jgi:hypothetical protein
MFTFWVVVAFYVVALAAILYVRWFYRLVNQPNFRDDHGDVSTEVGYEEDCDGNKIGGAFDDFDPANSTPHVHTTGNTQSGPM